MESGIERADPALRRLTVVVLVVATLVAVAAVLVFRFWLLRLAATAEPWELVATLRRWGAVTATASGVCVLLLAGHAARQARRVGDGMRWPPAGVRVLRDTRIRQGDAAVRIGRLLNVVALVLVLLGIGGTVAGLRLLAAG